MLHNASLSISFNVHIAAFAITLFFLSPKVQGGISLSSVLSAPATPGDFDSPPEAAIEATPENTPLSTPNRVSPDLCVIFSYLLMRSMKYDYNLLYFILLSGTGT